MIFKKPKIVKGQLHPKNSLEDILYPLTCKHQVKGLKEYLKKHGGVYPTKLSIYEVSNGQDT